MATGPKDTGQTQAQKISQDRATGRDADGHSVAWPDSGGMVEQQNAANKTFRQNSEKLQKAAEAD